MTISELMWHGVLKGVSGAFASCDSGSGLLTGFSWMWRFLTVDARHAGLSPRAQGKHGFPRQLACAVQRLGQSCFCVCVFILLVVLLIS